MPDHAPRIPVKDLIASLHANFGASLDSLPTVATAELEAIEVNCRCIDGIRHQLVDHYSNGQDHKRRCAQLLDEIFSDFALALYLFSVSLVVPARMLVRRALELGVASIYMWDLPHEYWGWIEQDSDLTFSKMVDHLNSKGYLAYVAHERRKSFDDDHNEICPSALQRFYRTLSQTVHGKAEGLPALSPARYSPLSNKLSEHLKLTVTVQNALITMWCSRFAGLSEYVDHNYPGRTRYK